MNTELYDEVLVVVALECFVYSIVQGCVVVYRLITLLAKRVCDVSESERLNLLLRTNIVAEMDGHHFLGSLLELLIRQWNTITNVIGSLERKQGFEH